jgi:hypothetical protein
MVFGKSHGLNVDLGDGLGFRVSHIRQERIYLYTYIHPKTHVDMTNKDLDRRRKTGQHIEIDLAIRNNISNYKLSLAKK